MGFYANTKVWQLSVFSSGSMSVGKPRWKGDIYWKINTRPGLGTDKNFIVYMYKNTYWLFQSLRLS